MLRMGSRALWHLKMVAVFKNELEKIENGFLAEFHRKLNKKFERPTNPPPSPEILANMIAQNPAEITQELADLKTEMLEKVDGMFLELAELFARHSKFRLQWLRERENFLNIITCKVYGCNPEETVTNSNCKLAKCGCHICI